MTSRSARATLTAGLTTALAATLTLATITPAHAETTTVKDGADTTASLHDIRTMRVEHGDKRVRVRFTFTDLRKKADQPAGLTVWFDTGTDQQGPEYVLGTGLQSGTDYQLNHTSGWDSAGGRVDCSYQLHLNWADDVLRGWFADDCFDQAEELRVAARMTDLADGSHPVTDWVEGPRNWTTWLSAG